jgi:ubiquinol-cytochrome c reductase cytochrome b subunit
MFSAILILLILPLADFSSLRGLQFKPASKFFFFIFVANLLALMVLGAKHAQAPSIVLGQIATVIYFANFLLAIPSLSTLENYNYYLLNDKKIRIKKVFFTAATLR